MSVDLLKQVRDALQSGQQVKAKSDEIVTAAISVLIKGGRNDRVLALRMLAHQQGKRVNKAIVKGLKDSERRVREVAIKCSRSFLDDKDVVNALEEIASCEKEKRKLRTLALDCLVGGAGPRQKLVPKTALNALQELKTAEKFRSRILLGLLRLDLNEQVETLLREFVKEGTKEEAVAATRALCGYRVVGLGELGDDKERKRVMRDCEPAVGRVFFWVKR